MRCRRSKKTFAPFKDPGVQGNIWKSANKKKQEKNTKLERLEQYGILASIASLPSLPLPEVLKVIGCTKSAQGLEPQA